jgi:hypothetical protein
MLAGALALSAAQFPVHHEHLPKVQTGCNGELKVDADGVSFKGHGRHAWTWKYEDIQQLTLSPEAIRIVTYEDRRARLGADSRYDFTGRIPAVALYADLKTRMDQRLVAELGQAAGAPEVGEPLWSAPVKHLRAGTGSQGRLVVGVDAILYTSPARGDSRTWRYADITNISSSGPFQFTIVTLEKTFNFQLKQPITEAGYNRIWLTIEKNNRRIQ